MIEVVCGVIEDGEGRYLACQRPREKHLGGLWEFPGGKVDPGETPAEALVRELKEELGITVAIIGALDAVVWTYERGQIRLLPFRCQILEGEPTAHEHENLLWCPVTEFNSLDWAGADTPILNQLRQLRQKTTASP